LRDNWGYRLGGWEGLKGLIYETDRQTLSHKLRGSTVLDSVLDVLACSEKVDSDAEAENVEMMKNGEQAG
jgi:hypothetical protein